MEILQGQSSDSCDTLCLGTGGDSDTIVDYYSELTQSEIAELFKKYQLDFELYGYDPEPYFEIAQVENQP